MSPHALASSASSEHGSKVSVSSSFATVKSNPFGAVADPSLVQNSSYLSASTIINQSLYAISSKIFSYEAPGAENLLDAHLQLWSQHYGRQNAFGVVPFFTSSRLDLELRMLFWDTTVKMEPRVNHCLRLFLPMLWCT